MSDLEARLAQIEAFLNGLGSDWNHYDEQIPIGFGAEQGEIAHRSLGEMLRLHLLDLLAIICRQRAVVEASRELRRHEYRERPARAVAEYVVFDEARLEAWKAAVDALPEEA